MDDLNHTHPTGISRKRRDGLHQFQTAVAMVQCAVAGLLLLLLSTSEAGAAVVSNHWAYLPPTRHATPAVKQVSWPSHWIDAFVLARLETEGLEPAADADPVTLVRRLSFDLTGLPPEPAEVDRFKQDHSVGAYEALVDRLLASSAYGERMAMYWLDLVRYADTVGYHGDQEHHISPYRDWVIDALNRNVPFDRFTRDQLAGDLAPGSGLDEKVATGYNRLLQTSHEGGVQAKEYLAIYAADRVRNVSSVWLGATLGCSQCHDHKYDPFTMKDFYSMAAIFADIDETSHLMKGSDSSPTPRPPEMKALSRKEREQAEALKSRITALEAALASSTAQGRVQLEADLQRATLALESLQTNARLTMITVAIPPRTVRLLPRGNWLDDDGPIMTPAVPECFGRLHAVSDRPTRLDLAHWLVDTKTGVGTLTARVMVNRFWYLLFGNGLARVLDDFGVQGEAPSHPALLDNLALEFAESGWDIKHMIKLLVLTRTYRQSSVVDETLLRRDPDNRLLAHQCRFRLPAEMMRDNALAVSGLLTLETGGPSIRPYQLEGYYKHLNFPPRTYEPTTGPGQWRRGVYVHWQRQYLHPTFKALDAPSREECTAQRPQSNTPLAALALLNDPTFVEAARVLAARILFEGGASTKQRLDFAFRQALSRSPDPWEQEQMTALLESNQSLFAGKTDAARALIGTGRAPVTEGLDPAEQAAWTMVSRALLNLNETFTRN